MIDLQSITSEVVVDELRLPPVPLDRPVSTRNSIKRTLTLARELEVHEVVIGLDHKVLPTWWLRLCSRKSARLPLRGVEKSMLS